MNAASCSACRAAWTPPSPPGCFSATATKCLDCISIPATKPPAPTPSPRPSGSASSSARATSASRSSALVCAPFAEAYLRGETPNPCVRCNPLVKFKALIDRADELGAPYVATGHYARARGGALFRGTPANDQSYMLCRLTREQAQRLLLPLGDLEKTQVRALAAEFGLPVAHKPDSMEICFIPDKDYAGWLARRGRVPGPGPVLFEGQPVARHEGFHRWTVGQRLPGLYGGRKLYVAAIRPDENALVAALWDDLFRAEFRVRETSWLVDPPKRRCAAPCASAIPSGKTRTARCFPKAGTRASSAIRPCAPPRAVRPPRSIRATG